MSHSGWGERGKRDGMCISYLLRMSQLMEKTGRVDDVERWYLPRISQLMGKQDEYGMRGGIFQE